MATIHTFTGNEVIATEVPQYLNQNFSDINTEVTNLSKNVVKTINGNKATNNNINISEFDSYWKAGEVVTVGDIRFLKGRDNTGIVLECTQTGTTGSNQPTVSDYVGMGGNGGEIASVLSAIEQVQTQVNKIVGITDYIVESYRNGTEWYEVYKSGRVRQGGYSTASGVNDINGGTITLLKQMANTNYNVLALNFKASGYHNASCTLIDKQTNYVKIGSHAYSSGYMVTGVYWEVEGQGA